MSAADGLSLPNILRSPSISSIAGDTNLTSTDPENTLLSHNANDSSLRRRPIYEAELNFVSSHDRRIILKNGDCNVIQTNMSERRRRYLQDIFTTLVDAQWRWTLFSFLMSFLVSWLIFACIWWIISYSHGDLLPENVNSTEWTPCVKNIYGFVSCFLYSIETQHSTGYGYRYPTEECPEAIVVVSVQSVTGVLIQAFMVGIMFAKMARPKQRTQTLLFSKHCVICQRSGMFCLQFRIGDMREKSRMINSVVRLFMVKQKITQEGEKLKTYFVELKVEVDDYDSRIFMIFPMTVVHKIDRHSPFYKLCAADVLREKFELIALLEGTTESTGQTTQARTSYVNTEILWGHRFVSLILYDKKLRAYRVDYRQFHETYQVDTPLCSPAELYGLIPAATTGFSNSELSFPVQDSSEETLPSNTIIYSGLLQSSIE